MSPEQLWQAFCRDHAVQNQTYQAWQFGESPDVLADLVARGIKTATCSLLYWYDVEGEDLPKVGQYDIVLNSREEAVAVIRTTQVFVTPFNQVSADHAYQEGEGDRSLAYWRQVHRDFFSRELTEVGVSFSSEMLLVCEVFECVYSIANCNSD